MYERWMRCRDVFEGSDAVKERRQLYLPALSGMDSQDYNVYLTNALFTNLSVRILDAFVGMLVRKEPHIEAPAEMMPYFEIDENGHSSFNETYKMVSREVLSTGRIGLLVDANEQESDPYISMYVTEDIVNWIQDPDTKRVSDVILAETYYKADGADKFDQSEHIRYRILNLEGGTYGVRVYEGATIPRVSASQTPYATSGSLRRPLPSTKQEFVDTTPQNSTGPLDYLPFYCVTPFGVNFTVPKPPLIDVVDINLSHYRTSADLEHGRHFTALPTPVISGVTGDAPLHIGSTKALMLNNPQAKAYYMEFTGQGLSTLERAQIEKRGQMSDFAARMIDASSKGSEALEAVQLRHSSDAAKLIDVLEAVESGLNVAYNEIRRWKGLTQPVVIKLDRDLLSVSLKTGDLRELLKAYLDGSIDENVLLFNLERGGFTPAGYKPPAGGKVREEDEA